MKRHRVLPDDRGSATVEAVIVLPALLLALLVLVQIALWSHATHIAQAAASRALGVARLHGGTASGGAEAARRVLDRLADGPLTGAEVQVDKNHEEVSASVRGKATRVVPFLELPVHARAAGPVERVLPVRATR